ncbi:DUF1178 family protein [Azospirillaceae bacterium]
MILFELKCTADHRFEAWFRDGTSFGNQKAAGTIQCPMCGDNNIEKAPMAPRINRKHNEDDRHKKQQKLQADIIQRLGELRDKIEQNCDYVGDRFAEEARKIHYGESDPRDIYGEATPTETEALQEEGVTFHRLPWLSRTNS